MQISEDCLLFCESYFVKYSLPIMHETCIILLVSCVSFSRKYIQELTDLRASSISNIKSGIPGIQKVFGGNLICKAGLDLPTLALDMRHALSGFEVRWPGICMAIEQLY